MLRLCELRRKERKEVRWRWEKEDKRRERKAEEGGEVEDENEVVGRMKDGRGRLEKEDDVGWRREEVIR